MDLKSVARIPPVTATAETTVMQAVQLMSDQQVGAIVITDADKHVLGIFTERDNMLRVTLKGRDPEKTHLSEVMSAPVVTAAPEDKAAAAMPKMLGRRHRHLPIVDKEKRIVGVVSVRQMLMCRLKEQESNLDVLSAYVEAGGPG